MGHTNQTANYNLPQFVGTDKPSWLGDINDAFAAIDTAIAAAASEASTADGKADALTTTVSGHTTQIGTLQNTVTSQGNTLNTVTSLIGNGTPTTTDQTIIGAINELHADQGDLDDLQTTDKSSMVAAINEVAQGGGSSATVRYYNGYIQYTDDGGTTWKNLFPVPSGAAIIPALASNTSASATVGTVSGTVDGTGQEVTLANAYKAFGSDGANIQYAHNIVFTFNNVTPLSKVSATLYSESAGTVAGSVKLQASPDGTSWEDVATSTLAGTGSENLEGTYSGYAKAIRVAKSDAAGMVNLKNLQAFD